MIWLYLFSALCLVVSLMANPRKTGRAVVIAGKKFRNILFPFAVMLIMISCAVTLLPESVIAQWLGGRSRWLSMLAASLAGSIVVLPGFIAFPLGGLLLKQGISYMVISAFTGTLMMVGVASFPVEREYLGTRLAFLRNIVSLVIAIIFSLVAGLAYGEIP